MITSEFANIRFGYSSHFMSIPEDNYGDILFLLKK